MSNKNLDKAQKDAPVSPRFQFGKPAGTSGSGADSSVIEALKKPTGLTAFELFKANNPDREYIDPSQGQAIRSKIRKALTAARTQGLYCFKVKVRETWSDGKEHNAKRYIAVAPDKVQAVKEALKGYEFEELKPVK